MVTDADQKGFYRYFPVSARDRKWGWYVTTAGEARIPAGQSYPPSGHPKGYHFDWTKGRVLDAHELVYISHGRGSIESQWTATQWVEAGQLMFLFPGVWHRYKPDPETGWNEHWIGFDGDVARSWVKRKFFLPQMPVFELRQEEKWQSLFNELIAVVKLNLPALQQVMAGFAAQMVGLLYSGHQTALAGDDQAVLIVQKAILRMQTGLESNLNAQEIARDLNVSYSSFRHTFQQHTGASPHQYLLELRQVRARNLLSQTMLSVKEIAQQAGFGDERYFCRFFKMKTGLTPGQWRSRSRSKRRA